MKMALQINISQIIDQIGFGKFQVFAILALSMRSFSFGSKVSMLAILEPYLRCKWDLDFISAAMIVLPESFVKIFASALVGRLADKYGRRRMMLLLYAMHSFTSLLNLLSSSLFMIVLTRAVIGFQSCNITIMQTYLLEILPTSGRKHMSLFMIAYTLGSSYAILVAMLSLEYLHWRWYIALTEALPLAIAAIFVAVLPESPRYLLMTGQESDAMLVLKRIAMVNGKDENDTMIAEKDEENETTKIVPEQENDNIELHNPLSRWEIARRIGLLSLLSFISYTTSQTVRFGTMQTGENANSSECGNCARRLTYKYRWAMELGLPMSFIISYNCIRIMKRITSYKSILILLIIVWVFQYFDGHGWFLIVLTFLACVLGAAFITFNNVYQGEIIPSSIRATGNGVGAAAKECGFLFGQFLSLYLYHVNFYISYGIVHGLLVIGLLATFTIFVETKDEELRDF